MKFFKHKSQATKIQQENEAEQRVLKPTKIRFNNYWNRKGIGTFHKSQFSFCSSTVLLITLILIGNLFGEILQESFKLVTGSNIRAQLHMAQLQSISYIVTEFLPMIIVIWLYNNRNHFKSWIASFCNWRLKHRHFRFQKLAQVIHSKEAKKPKKWIWFVPYKRLAKEFWNEIKRNYKLILFLLVGIEVINILIKTVFVPIAGVNIATPLTTTLIKLAKSDWLIIPSLIFIVPPTEEFMYRICLPNIIAGCFDRLFKRHHFVTTKYIGASIFSAIVFTQNHIVSGYNWGMALSIFVFAIILQVCYRKSKSMTLPVILHSLANLLKVIVEI